MISFSVIFVLNWFVSLVVFRRRISTSVDQEDETMNSSSVPSFVNLRTRNILFDIEEEAN